MYPEIKYLNAILCGKVNNFPEARMREKKNIYIYIYISVCVYVRIYLSILMFTDKFLFSKIVAFFMKWIR